MDDAPARIKVKKASSGCPLPEEVVEEILSRLPARTLCRFQCVSRSFRAVISSRAFEDAHYQRHSSCGDRRRLFIRPAAGAQEPFYAWRPGFGGGGGPAVVETIMSVRGGLQLPEGSIFPVSKSCRGLVLLRNTDHCTYHVWNPSTGETLTLPDKIPLRARWGSPVSYGLGYCSATQRHKVVRVYDACGYDGYGPAPATICEVFTLRESAYWRPVATGTWHHRGQNKNWRQGGVLCNGKVHFLDHHGGVIAVFDVKDETLGTLKTPPELQLQEYWRRASNLELTELGGSLCIYTVYEKERCYLQDEPKYLVDMWLLRDYDYGTAAAAAKWEKLRRIDCRRDDGGDLAMMLKSPRITPLDMYHDDDDIAAAASSSQKRRRIVFATGACDVFIVDPDDTGATKLAFSPKDTAIGECRRGAASAIGLFEESLARVGSLSENTAFGSPWMRAWSEVLSRLPTRAVRSLDQVCRDWRAMVKSDHFTAAHLHRANLVNRGSPQVMFVDVNNGTPYTFEPAENYYINTPYGHLPPPPVIDSSRTAVVFSKPCHGLNACSFNGYDFVCNPATGYCKALPPPTPTAGAGARGGKGLSTYDDFVLETILMGLHQREEDNCTTTTGGGGGGGFVGLGYERETSRHVLVRFVYEERNLATRGYKMVCSMRYLKGMVWDEVDPPPRPVANNMPPCHVNGKLYWMVDTELSSSYSDGLVEIVALDVSTRKFEVLQGPTCANVDHRGSVIIELEDMVCMTCSHRNTGILEVWAMGDKSASMWSVRYNIELQSFAPEYSPETTMPLALDPKDGRILLSTGRSLGYYNPKTAELETICRLGKQHQQGMKFVPILFQESLVNPCHRSV